MSGLKRRVEAIEEKLRVNVPLALTAADWAKRKGLGREAEQHCRAYAYRAEIKMGEMLAATKPERAKGAIEPGTKRGTTRLHDATASEPTLADLGLSKRESAEAQMLASLPEAKQQAVIAGDLTPTAARREQQREAATRAAHPLPTDKGRVKRKTRRTR